MNKFNQQFAIEVEDLTVAYDAKPALWDIDLQIPRGQIMAISTLR